MKAVWLCICLAPLAAQAIEPEPSSRPQQGTETWLTLQSTNKAASRTVQVASPAEREQSLQRWLDSYQDKIPDFYSKDSGGAISE